MKSPTARTVEKLRAEGWMVDVVERRVPGTRKVTKDLYGFIDILAVRPGRILGVQATAGGNLSHRRKKIRYEKWLQAKRWLEAGGEIEIWEWRQLKTRDGEWHPNIEKIEKVEGS